LLTVSHSSAYRYILKESETEIPKCYESEFAGLQVRQDYQVINLGEVDVEIN
jgi:hypothetical protein